MTELFPLAGSFFLFTESRSLGGGGGGGGGLQVAFMARDVKYFYESYTV